MHTNPAVYIHADVSMKHVTLLSGFVNPELHVCNIPHWKVMPT